MREEDIMRPPTPIPENRVSELEVFRKEKWSGFEFQRFLCVWLRVAQDMSTADISKAIGWNVKTVRATQKDFIERGIVALVELKRGGRHNARLTPEEERDFLLSFDESAAKGSMLIANEIKDALEKRLGRKVHKTTVYRMLHRNGWRKIAPKPSHPKRDKAAGEAFKKGASPKG
jgi:transposase